MSDATPTPAHGSAARSTGSSRRLSTPLVLVATSAMLCVGVVGFFLSNNSEPDAVEAAPTTTIVDTSTPERTAESFLDAWRKRDHAVAARLSGGEALSEVEARRRRDENLSAHERELKAQVWDAMASERLRLLLHEAENLDGGRIRLSGHAEGTFLGGEYQREMTFVVRPDGDAWLVDTFIPGEILSDTPSLLQLDD